MTNPTQVQIDKLTTNLTRWDSIVNGAAGSTVALDAFTVKTVAGYLAELLALNPQGAWGTSTAYALKDVVTQTSVVYICTVAHTSGTFATDLSAGKWAIYQLDVTSAISFADDFTVDTTTFHVDSTNNRVGIGITSPLSPLHILSTDTPTNGVILMASTSNDVDTVGFSYTYVANNDIDLHLGRKISSDGAFVPYMTMDVTGKFGIGTTSPGSFSVSGDNLVLYDSGNCGISLIAGTTGESALYFGDTLTTGTASRQGQIRYYHTSDSMTFFTNGDNPRVSIDSAGNVGIGTSSPSHLLHLYSTAASLQIEASDDSIARIVLDAGATSDGIIIIQDDNVNTWAFGMDSTNSNAFNFSNSGTLGSSTRLVLTTAGLLGLGGTTPISPLSITSVDSPTNGILLMSSSSNDDDYVGMSYTYNANNDLDLHLGKKLSSDGAFVPFLTMDVTGNFGIGTTTVNTKALLDLTSTTQGFLPPRMTTTQRDAISTPPAGLVVYNTTTSKLNVYTSAWEAVTSA